MEKKTKTTIKKGLFRVTYISALFLGITHFNDIFDTVSYRLQPRLRIEMNDTKKEKQETVEEKSHDDTNNLTWATYNEEVESYNVDIDKMFDKYLLKNCIIKVDTQAIKIAKNEIKDYLGDYVYCEEIDTSDLVLTNLNGREIYMCTDDDNVHYSMNYTDENNNLVEISGNYNDYNYVYEKKYDSYMQFDKYCEYTVSRGNPAYLMIFRRNDDLCIDFAIRGNNLIISSENGTAVFKLTSKEKSMLVDTVTQYNHSQDMRQFLNENNELISNYLEEIKAKNNVLYMEIINAINQVNSEQLTTKNDIKEIIKTI